MATPTISVTTSGRGELSRACLWALLGMAIFLRYGSAWAAEAATDNREITEIFQADQDDRTFFTTQKPSEWKPDAMRAMMLHDAERRKRVAFLLVEGKVQSALDYYHAAMVFQHSDLASDFLQAHILSTISAMKGYGPARWLSAASLDRYLQKIKQPQIFGTQYRNEDPKQALSGWTMEPYDRSIPNPVRHEYGVPSLDESLKRLDALRNDRPLVQPSPKS